MRARDVSRPRAEDLAEAAESEEAVAHPRGSVAAQTPVTTEATPGRAADSTSAAARPADEAKPSPPLPVPPSRRQRRRTR